MIQDSLGTQPLDWLRQHYLQRLASGNRPVQSWHEFWLRRCCELALQGLGRVAPNPLVGAIIVRPKNKNIARSVAEYLDQPQVLSLTPDQFAANWAEHFELLGQGYHAACGQLHAEAQAFAAAYARGYGPQDFQQAVLYCNLEPCGYQAATKKQPPCCEQIVAQQIGAVVFANTDPNPAVAGKGAERLRQAGLAVRSGDFARPSAMINQIFFRHMAGLTPKGPQLQRPWVSLKLAQSLDGCIATKSGHSQWISGPLARSVVQALRASHGAVCSGVAVGRRTLEADNPSLLLRQDFMAQLGHSDGEIPLSLENEQRLQMQQPWRIVWDSQLASSRLPLQFYQGPHQERSVVICHDQAVQNGQIASIANIAKITLDAPLWSHEGLTQALNALTNSPYHLQHLLLEGGSQLASSFLAAGLVDEAYCFVSQRFIGKGLKSLQDLQPGRDNIALSDTLQLYHSSSTSIAEDWDGPDEVLCHGYLSDIFVPQDNCSIRN